MDLARVRVGAALLLTMPVTLAAQSADPSCQSILVVRVFNYAQVSRGREENARREADAILCDAGIQIAWRDCPIDRYATSAPVQCTQAIGSDVMMRINPASLEPDRRYVSMGFSLVNSVDGTAPYLATVYADAIDRVAREANISVDTLMGRAMAHEIGHLLLGSDLHAATGLMRAVWSNDELRRPGHLTDWRFIPDEARSMRVSLRRRIPAS